MKLLSETEDTHELIIILKFNFQLYFDQFVNVDEGIIHQ